MEHEEKTLMRYILLLSCIKNGYISIKKASRKLDWSKQKIIAVGNLLCNKGVLSKHFVGEEPCEQLIGFYLENI